MVHLLFILSAPLLNSLSLFLGMISRSGCYLVGKESSCSSSMFSKKYCDVIFFSAWCQFLIASILGLSILAITKTCLCNIQRFFSSVKLKNFIRKKMIILILFAQNIDCGYTQSMF